MSTATETRSVIRTEDLGHEWFANLYDDGTITIRSPERRLRIDLPKDSVDRLRNIFAQSAGTSAI